MRESIAHALIGLSSLQSDDYRERPVDRLHALASAQIGKGLRTEREAHLAALGKSWIALRDAFRLDERDEVLARLTGCLMWSKPRPTERAADKVARWTIIERIHENCPTCKGRGEIPDAEKMAGRVFSAGDGAVPMRECPECHGRGRHVYSNSERISGMGIEPGELHKYSRLLADAEMWLGQAEHQAIKVAKKLLERL